MNPKRNRLWSNEDFLLTENVTHCYTHPNCSVALHFHTFIELNIVSDGYGVHHIHNGDIQVKRGNVFIIPQNTPHAYTSTNNLTVKHILISNNFFSEYAKELKDIENFETLFKIFSFFPDNNSPLFLDEERFKVFETYWAILESNHLTRDSKLNKTNAQKVLASSLILSLISFLCTSFNLSTNKPHLENNSKDIIAKAIEYISGHYDEKLTNTMLADLCNLSESTFLRYFNKLLNMTPATYIAKHRISHAKILLEKNQLSITQIAQETGFFDSSHFNRTFKKITGISPLNYKKNLPVSQSTIPL